MITPPAPASPKAPLMTIAGVDIIDHTEAVLDYVGYCAQLQGVECEECIACNCYRILRALAPESNFLPENEDAEDTDEGPYPSSLPIHDPLLPADPGSLYEATMTLCGVCLNGGGGVCHQPGCRFIRSLAPDIPLCGVEGADYQITMRLQGLVYGEETASRA